VLNPEQTASIFSYSFFFFLDHIIFLAYRESQLQEEELYPLCDSDASTHLKKRSFKANSFHTRLILRLMGKSQHLDSFSSRKSHPHIFFGLMRVFRREFTLLAGIMVLRVLTSFSGYELSN
jgi:hypothetical protein